MSPRSRTGPSSAAARIGTRCRSARSPALPMSTPPISAWNMSRCRWQNVKNMVVGERSGGNTVKTTNIYPDPDPRGYLKAIDPMTGEAKWQTGFKSPNWAGTLVTAGGLVFTGELTGEFIAVDSDTGKILWQF